MRALALALIAIGFLPAADGHARASGRVSIRVGPFPIAVTVGFHSVWVVAHNGYWVARVDPKTNRVVARVKVGAYPRAAIAAFDSIWIANSGNGSLSRIDPRRNKVIATVPVLGPSNSTDVVATRHRLWVSDYGDGSRSIAAIDPRHNRVVRTVPLAHVSIVFADGSLWAADTDHQRVLELDPNSGRVEARIHVAGVAPAVGPQSFGYGRIWLTATSGGAGKLFALNPRTKRTSTAGQVAAGPGAPAVGAGGIWVASGIDGVLVKIDPRALRPRRTIRVGAPQNDNEGPTGLATGFGSAWVVRFTNAGTVVRVPATQ